MKTAIVKSMPQILLFLSPFVKWFDRVFTAPFSMKKINADHYFIWKPKLVRGMVLISDTYGQGSNLLNPSKGKHGAIYFGYGLKTHIEKLVASEGETLGTNFYQFYDAHKGKISDDIEYVIEALGVGVTVSSAIKFLTTKDVILGFIPRFGDQKVMNKAAESAVYDLGVPYDYAFNGTDEAKYCFEVLIDAYRRDNQNLNFVMENYFGYDVYLSTAFKDEKMWVLIIDSRREFPELYAKRP